MKIQIDGTNTNNKGAELMLYAILEQIEERYPQALVCYNPNNYTGSVPIETKLRLKKKPGMQYYKRVIPLLKKFKLPTSYFSPRYAVRNIDLVLDGGGFQFSDQWKYSEGVLKSWEIYYKKLKANGTKVILLSQAFGPFETENSQRTISFIKKYVDILVARESVSYDYLLKAGIDPAKLWLYSDFTLAVSGTFPKQHHSIKGKICIIPNKKMITHGNTYASNYMTFYRNILAHLKVHNREAFLLNHEGKGDLQLCHDINNELNSSLPIITGLNAKEIKSVIGSSELVISSRYHGVASALNQAVPCLATSWSHKYELLFKDFGLSDMILNINFPTEQINAKLDEVLDKNNYAAIENTLAASKKILLTRTQEMWDKVWKYSFPA